MNKLRQRIPFKFSADDEENEDTRVLDEQEQEEVIETLRKENASFTQHYYKFLQGCLSFTILFRCWFLVSPRGQVTPFHVFLPKVKTPLPSLIPFATCFTLLDILILMNVMLHLPKDLSFPRLLHSVMTNVMSKLPLHIREVARSHIPAPITWSVCLLCVPPVVSVFAIADTPQILWWSFSLFVVGIVVLVRSWINETHIEMEKLEKMKYEAKGA